VLPGGARPAWTTSDSRVAPVTRAATRSGGDALPESLRGDMEGRFGHDFGHVRVHTDTRASASADLLDAPAYATGADIVFGAGRFEPTSGVGLELLAHELAHVVQHDRGDQASAPTVDDRGGDGLEQDAARRAGAALYQTQPKSRGGALCQCSKCRAARGEAPLENSPDEGTCPCSRSGGEESAPAAPDTSTATSVHRAPWEPRRAPGAPSPGHTPGDDYQGPHGAVTRDENPASLGGSTALGGAVSYGCYCGPGGKDDTGSRCGVGAAAVDEIDEQCRQHDANYGLRRVDSGDREGTNNMWSLPWLLDSADADERLRASVESAMDANPESFSPSARLYGQGIKGIFGGRARTAEAYQFGADRLGRAESGLTGAYDDASAFLDERAGTGWNLLGSEIGGAGSFIGSALGRAGSGVSDFANSVGNWGSLGDAVSGVSGAAMDALGFTGGTAYEGLTRAAGGLGDVASFVGDSVWSGGSGILDNVTSGLGFAADTAGRTALGLGGAAADASEWGVETLGAIGGVGADLAGRGIDSAIDTITSFDPTDIVGPLMPTLPDIALPDISLPDVSLPDMPSLSDVEEWLPW
jgi:hypothetical protein